MSDVRARFARLIGEARMLRELPRFVAGLPDPPEVDEPALVVLVPGLGAHDAAMSPLGRYLRKAGHLVFNSGLGMNVGSLADDVIEVSDRVTRLAGTHGMEASLVGWSMGGLIAREVARVVPDDVARIVTFGTPLEGPRYTSLAMLFGQDRTRKIERRIDAARAIPITVPITAIYSRVDGIVDWRSCIDRHNPNVTHVEVDGAHLSMNINPRVWEIVAASLSPPQPDSDTSL